MHDDVRRWPAACSAGNPVGLRTARGRCLPGGLALHPRPQHADLAAGVPAPTQAARSAWPDPRDVLLRRPLRADARPPPAAGAARTRGPLVPRLPRARQPPSRRRRPPSPARVLLSRGGVPGGTPGEAGVAVPRWLRGDRGAYPPRQRHRGQLPRDDHPLQEPAARAPRRPVTASGDGRAHVRLHPRQLVPGQLEPRRQLVRPGQRAGPAAGPGLLCRFHHAIGAKPDPDPDHQLDLLRHRRSRAAQVA